MLPGLQAFCTTCAIAIGAIFVLQSSWFVAWMTLDELRIQEKRDGLAPCLVHRDWIPPKWSTGTNTGKKVMSFVGNLFKRAPVQMLVLFTTAALLAVGVWGTLQIKVHFDPIKLMPKSSYLRQFADQGWIQKSSLSVSISGQILHLLDKFAKCAPKPNKNSPN